MADITIGIVASAREWRSVLQAHVRDHVAGVKVQILREPRMALELDLDVVVIDDVSSFLTRDKVVRLREKGTRVVGIYDEEGNEGLGVEFLNNLGVDLSLPSNISPEEMINAVQQLKPKQSYTNTFDHVVADYSGQAQAPIHEDSTMICVSGPAGTGSTEIAIALADVLVARRNATLLLDVDEVGPSVARRLGFSLHPNILSAIDTVANVTRPLTEMVGRPGDRAAHSINFDVIPGIANPEDWSQLRTSDMDDLFAAARKSWRYIVCNAGPFAEDLSGYGIERFGSTRTALQNADVIIGVMNPSPTGYLRFLDWLATLRTLGSDRAVYVVVNRAPKSNYIRAEIENQLAKDVDSRFIAGLFFISEDEHVAKAEWEGQKVSKGPFITGVAEVASYAVPMMYSKGKKSKGPSRVEAPIQPAQPVAQNYQTGYSSGFENNIMPQPPAAPVSVSWDDPDIANPVNQAPVEQATIPQPTISLDEQPSAFFESEHPVEQAQYVEEPQEQQTQVDNSQTYSYTPPVHNVESFNDVQQNVQTESPQQNPLGDGYVPAYKRGSEAQDQVSYVDDNEQENSDENKNDFWS